jgi:two-component system, OmpR family, response regulator ChvI
VDDEPDLTSLFKKVVESAGFNVNVLNTSNDAVRDFKPHFYDLVMLDIVMPKIDGFDLYKELKN